LFWAANYGRVRAQHCAESVIQFRRTCGNYYAVIWLSNRSLPLSTLRECGRVKQFAGGGRPAWYCGHMKQARESDSEAFNMGRDEAAVEFELSPQDLLALSRPGAIQGPTPGAAQSDAGSPADGPVSSQAQTARKHGKTASWDRQLSAPRIGVSLSIVVAVVLTGVVLYLYSRPDGTVRPVTATAPRTAVPLARPSSTPSSDQLPLRFANPFDHTEVFEFPAGTSKPAAREAVAEVLMKRARDRQHLAVTGKKS
jgi:hypothetical protein